MFKILLLIFSFYLYSNAVIFEDMFKEKSEIKDDIKKIYASNPVLLYSLYAVDKSKIAGLNFPFNENEAKFLDEKTKNLPVLGGWFGQGKTPNSEMILQINPDVILLTDNTKKLGDEKIKASLGGAKNIPLIYLKSNSLEELVDSFSYIGKLTNNEKRAKELENYGKDSLNLAKEVSQKASKKPKVYYAEGKNGLETECNTSIHSELINLAGGKNVHQCETTNLFGKQAINFEQVLAYNPEIILVYDKEFYQKIYKDSNWKHIDAVKNRRVYFLPFGPFSWFDRPPSFMKLLGLRWLLSVFHPEVYKLDINKEAKEFYSLFLGIDLSDEQLNEIIGKNLE
ncbi:ABC transporter substrate-binding protein [Arcobacter defluvii]|uniref:Iron siderophore ABC transporter, periplasmic substrate-binding protein n=1 Tax=Arcobacter defluvii TaxID=873191 RepID=A0AAE7BBD2_9BACT|nr:ABC transporter substrate-binding protein [Arcobacter defluvii]QKF76108.1 iron siderophore ABC transporter, periplasmic substrate-binding protein [Arcobacter defluvii]RXI32264.1 ABC transporter substrate-binding protein [Arcobacter defluvii]